MRLGDTSSSPEDRGFGICAGRILGVMSDSLLEEDEAGDQDSCEGNGAAPFWVSR